MVFAIPSASSSAQHVVEVPSSAGAGRDTSRYNNSTVTMGALVQIAWTFYMLHVNI